MKLTEKDTYRFNKATYCHICKKPLNDDKVRDHCHISGAFRGAAHNTCNLNFKYQKNIPIIFHNLRGYDSHLIMQHLGKYDDNITCIPNNMEKYVSFSLGKLIFKDSLQFLNASLEKLAANLKTFKHIHELTDLETLITRKCVYPYDYMDSFDKFNDDRLPPQLAFYSIL